MALQPEVWLLAMGIWSLAVFCLYGLDKWKAQNGQWRIRERILITFAFLFGGIGAVCGMIVFHHKSSNLKFRALVPLSLICTLTAIFLLCQAGIMII